MIERANTFSSLDELQLAIKWAGAEDPVTAPRSPKEQDEIVKAYREALTRGTVPEVLRPPLKYLKSIGINSDLSSPKENTAVNQDKPIASAQASMSKIFGLLSKLPLIGEKFKQKEKDPAIELNSRSYGILSPKNFNEMMKLLLKIEKNTRKGYSPNQRTANPSVSIFSDGFKNISNTKTSSKKRDGLIASPDLEGFVTKYLETNHAILWGILESVFVKIIRGGFKGIKAISRLLFGKNAPKEDPQQIEHTNKETPQPKEKTKGKRGLFPWLFDQIQTKRAESKIYFDKLTPDLEEVKNKSPNDEDKLNPFKKLMSSFLGILGGAMTAISALFGGLKKAIEGAIVGAKNLLPLFKDFATFVMHVAKPLSLAIAPLLAMYGATKATEWMQDGENAKTVMDKATEMGMLDKPLSEQSINEKIVPQEDIDRSLMGKWTNSAHKARAKNIQDSFELGRTYTPSQVERIKKAYDITVPTDNIVAEVKPKPQISEEELGEINSKIVPTENELGNMNSETIAPVNRVSVKVNKTEQVEQATQKMVQSKEKEKHQSIIDASTKQNTNVVSQGNPPNINPRNGDSSYIRFLEQSLGF